MSSFIEGLVAGGSDYIVTATKGGLSLRPTGDSVEALEAFQPIAQQVFDKEGDGYNIYGYPHYTRDHSKDYCDLIILVIEE